MKVIVITGIDGSGKSTLLSSLFNSEKQYPVLTLPHFKLESLVDDVALHGAALFINQLNHEADLRKIPPLKAVALFASMLLFNPIVKLMKSSGQGIVFCERHPLIDTSIYAGFYAQKLHPGSINQLVLEDIETKYAVGLNYLQNFIPKLVLSSSKGICETFIAFIYDWFHIKNKTSISDLKEIFNVDLPHRIFYLNASPDFLFNRIKNREILEAHESIDVFRKLGHAYAQLFSTLGKECDNLIDIVASDNKEHMQQLYEKLVSDEFLND